MNNENIKLLHQWDVVLPKEVDESSVEQREGGPVTVTRKVKKDVSVLMGLKQPTRRELRQAELFYGKRFNWYINEGFLPSSILTNKHLNLTGGILSDKEKDKLGSLQTKQVELENDMVRALNETDEVKKKLQRELGTVRAELLNLYAVNQVVFSQTADKRAERDLNDWFAYHLILIDRSGKWDQYFVGDTFDKKEEFMWKLEEDKDEFYSKAVEKISVYIQFFNMGLNTSEKFKAAEEELKRQLDSRKDETTPPAEPNADGPSTPSVS